MPKTPEGYQQKPEPDSQVERENSSIERSEKLKTIIFLKGDECPVCDHTVAWDRDEENRGTINSGECGCGHHDYDRDEYSGYYREASLSRTEARKINIKTALDSLWLQSRPGGNFGEFINRIAPVFEGTELSLADIYPWMKKD